MGRIKVEIGLEVAAPALLTFWNVPLPAILIRRSDEVYFQKFPDLVHEISNWKTPLSQLYQDFVLFLIFLLNQLDLDIIIENIFRRFCRLGKGGINVKRGKRNQNWTHTHLSLPSSLIFSFKFSSWPYLAKLLYLVEGN